MLNFFRINDQLHFVDLPGYGFAKVPMEVRARWKPMVEGYLTHRKTLKLVIILVDIRRTPTQDDASLTRWLETYDIPFLIVLTKADKISRSKASAQQKVIKEFLLLKDEESIMFSAVTRQGRKEILSYITGLI